jgi:hypothetical protein
MVALMLHCSRSSKVVDAGSGRRGSQSYLTCAANAVDTDDKTDTK